MKKFLSFAILATTCAVLFTACNKNNFKKTENGLLYKFETTVADGEQPNVGDLLVGELILRLENDTLFSNMGHPDRIFQVAETPMFKGDIQEGLLMMHKGDKAIFKIPADSIANFMQPNQMPQGYQTGKGQFFYYEITLNDIVTKDELAQEQANFMEEMEQRKNDEPAAIQKYLADNNITAKPTKSGLYVIVNKKGTGTKVATGKKVAIDYTGRLLDGTLFDTSREADAKAANKYMEGREYKPLEYVVGGSQSMIKGWEEGVMGQPAGSEITLIIPSELAYGARGAMEIMPYSPLTFDLTIVSVE